MQKPRTRRRHGSTRTTSCVRGFSIGSLTFRFNRGKGLSNNVKLGSPLFFAPRLGRGFPGVCEREYYNITDNIPAEPAIAAAGELRSAAQFGNIGPLCPSMFRRQIFSSVSLSSVIRCDRLVLHCCSERFGSIKTPEQGDSLQKVMSISELIMSILVENR